MKRREWLDLLAESIAGLEEWESSFPEEAELPQPTDADREALSALTERLRGSYPFFHPRYAGQLLKPPHPIAWLAHAVADVINANNHARDGGPTCSDLETEAIAALAALVGYDTAPEGHLGHLTGGGTVANLEALWVARETHPGKAIAIAENAHYTHARMCSLLAQPTVQVATDARDRIDVNELRRVLEGGQVGTIVATPGTTGLGAVDPIHDIADLAAEFGVRLHIDAAYGGFFRLLAQREPPLVEPEPFAAFPRADSIAIDPHKHGLQPFGCGCILFRDPGVAKQYGHDSPYTYFSSPDRHLGQVSLECSRPGSAAAALWATIRAIPLAPDHGLGESLARSRRAALAWSAAIDASDELELLTPPDTDVVAFAPLRRGQHTRASAVSAASEKLYRDAMTDTDSPIFLATYRASRQFCERRWGDSGVHIDWNQEYITVLRSVLMKPSHEQFWPELHRRVEELARDAHD